MSAGEGAAVVAVRRRLCVVRRPPSHIGRPKRVFPRCAVWWNERNALLFSDTVTDKIFKWTEENGVEILIDKSGGYDGNNINNYSHRWSPGSNGLAIDS